MKRKLFIGLLSMALVLLLAGCGCEHEWLVATCSAPKTCQLCGETEGEVLPHTWLDATCTEAKTCSVCKVTEGEPLGHTWQEATCTTVKTCTVCQITEGEPLGHTWQEATCSAPKTCSSCKLTEGDPADHKWQAATTEAPKTCSVCAATEGSKLNTDSRFTTKATKQLQGTWICDVAMTEDITGLTGFGSVDCRMTLKFGNTGKMTITVKPKNEKAFKTSLQKYNEDLLYAAFAQNGFSKSQADEAMIAEYGLNVHDYVEASLKGYDVGDAFKAFRSEGVYYVKDGKLFSALSWKAKFEESAFTLKSGTLTVEGLSLTEGGADLKWKKA